MAKRGMSKRCGYVTGHCLSSERCCLSPEDFGELLGWGRLQKEALSCPFHRPPKRPSKFGLWKQRRRRDWKVGNPYKKER